MAKATHTPGPWRIESNPFVIVAGEGFSIADTAPGNPLDVSQGTARANAKLIVTAPEMLSALQKYEHDYCEGWCKENGGSFSDCGGCAARAVVAKATGNSH